MYVQIAHGLMKFLLKINFRPRDRLEKVTVKDLPCYYSTSPVENMVKKNRSRFPIVVLLTTLICNHEMITDLFLGFTIAILIFWEHVIHR